MKKLLAKQNSYWAVAAIGCMGLIISALAYVFAEMVHEKNLKSEFSALSKEGAAVFRLELSKNLQILESIGAFFEASDSIDAQKFAELIGPFVRNNEQVSSIAWAPKVLNKDLEQFEDAVRFEIASGFSVFQLIENGKIAPASKREFYFPLLFLEPPEYSIVRGFDVASEENRLNTLRIALRSGKVVASPFIRALHKQDNKPGLLMVKAVFFKQNWDAPLSREENLAGFVLEYFSVAKALEQCGQMYKIDYMDSYLEDESANRNTDLVYCPVVGESSQEQVMAEQETLKDVSEFEWAGRKWRIINVARPEFFKTRASYLKYQLGGLGLACTFIIASYLWLVIKRAEGIRKLNKQLIKTKASLELEIEQRRKIERKLTEHDKLKTEFVSTVSHELRTPLCIFKNVISNAMAGVMGPISGRLKDNLQMADETINRLARIISDFLDIARIEENKMELRPVLIDMSKLVRETILQCSGLAEKKSITIHPDGCEGEVNITADRDRLIQVLTNLLSNAVKFTGENGRIIVRLKELEESIITEVEDNGTGIAANDIEKIFARFVQVHKTIGPGNQGTGLGLTIAKSIVELHGGKIWAESQPGQGSRFCFMLPKTHEQAKSCPDVQADNEHSETSKAKTSCC